MFLFFKFKNLNNSKGLGGLTCNQIISCTNNICKNNGICSIINGIGSCQCQPG